MKRVRGQDGKTARGLISRHAALPLGHLTIVVAFGQQCIKPIS